MDTFDISQYKKLDLHIHTPSSLCYSDMTVKPHQIVDAAVASGLDAIAITDHNTVEGIEDIRVLAGQKGLFIFPGIELTTRSGHFLAIFDVDTAVVKLRELLDDLGVTPSSWGDATEAVRDDALDVFKKVVEFGGLVVAAHIERWPSGFLETKESRSVKMAIHASPYLSALEITIAQNRGQWHEGRVRGYPRKFACIQGSDAHTPAEIGRRPFLVRMGKIELVALKSAFMDWNNSIIFPDEINSKAER
ncbi:MAG: PHP domain-containing protein [Sedimentisphaerales bacterium]|nr:PHP domain-containing protein [Sedimentisphaerales bacterium]